MGYSQLQISKFSKHTDGIVFLHVQSMMILYLSRLWPIGIHCSVRLWLIYKEWRQLYHTEFKTLLCQLLLLKSQNFFNCILYKEKTMLFYTCYIFTILWDWNLSISFSKAQMAELKQYHYQLLQLGLSAKNDAVGEVIKFCAWCRTRKW